MKNCEKPGCAFCPPSDWATKEAQKILSTIGWVIDSNTLLSMNIAQALRDAHEKGRREGAPELGCDADQDGHTECFK